MKTVPWMMLLPRALASRSESASMLQVGEVQAHLLERTNVGRDNQLAGMKDQILALAETGVPAAAVPLLNTIKSTLSGGILEAIQNETTAATTLDGTLRKAFTDASTKFTNAKDAENTAKDTTVPNLRSTHITCRNDQKTLNETHNTCVGKLATARSEYATSHGSAIGAFEAVTTGSAADADSDSACVNGITWRNQPDASLDAMSTALDTYKGAIDDLKSKRTTFNNKLTECGYQDSGNKADHFKVSAVSPAIGALKKVLDKTTTCNTDQTDYQNGACALSRALTKANRDYDTDYNNAKNAYTDQSTIWQGETANRFHQCQFVHTLICYVDGLIAKDDKSALQSEVGKCDAVAANYDAANKADRAYNTECSQYEFAAGAIPTRDSDATVPASPCGAGWDLGVNHGVIAPNAECKACDPAICAKSPQWVVAMEILEDTDDLKYESSVWQQTSAWSSGSNHISDVFATENIGGIRITMNGHTETSLLDDGKCQHTLHDLVNMPRNTAPEGLGPGAGWEKDASPWGWEINGHENYPCSGIKFNSCRVIGDESYCCSRIGFLTDQDEQCKNPGSAEGVGLRGGGLRELNAGREQHGESEGSMWHSAKVEVLTCSCE